MLQLLARPRRNTVKYIAQALLIRKQRCNDKNQNDEKDSEYDINGCSKHVGTSPKNARFELNSMRFKKVIWF